MSCSTKADGSISMSRFLALRNPDRVVAGAGPGRGVVVTGTVTALRPAGASWEATVTAGARALPVRLAEPAPAGAEFVLTALDPPFFGPDGAALAPAGTPVTNALPPEGAARPA